MNEENIIKVVHCWSGRHHSEESKKKMSEAKKGKTTWINGRHHSEETKRKISLANKGKKRTEEVKRKLSLLRIGKKQSPETIARRIATGRERGTISMLGQHHTEATKKKLSQSMRGLNTWSKGKKQSQETINKRISTMRKTGKFGMSGKHYSEEEKLKLSIAIREAYKNHPEYGKKISNSNKGKRLGKDNPFFGKKHSKEVLKIISEANKGKIISEENRKNLSKLYSGEGNPFFGQRHTEESRNKIILKRSSPEFVASFKEHRLKQVLPVKDSKPEKKIQTFLTELNIAFVKHKPIMNIEHPYQCDIFVPSLNLVIEADGDIFHAHPSLFKPDDIIPMVGYSARKKWDLDDSRTKELQEVGYKVLRFWECDIKKMSVDEFKSILSSI